MANTAPTVHVPPLSALEHLLAAGLVRPEARIRTWATPTPTASQARGGYRRPGRATTLHSKPECTAARATIPAERTDPVLTLVRNARTNRHTWCSCAQQPRTLNRDTAAPQEVFFDATGDDLAILLVLEHSTLAHAFPTWTHPHGPSPIERARHYASWRTTEVPRSTHHALNQYVAQWRTRLDEGHADALADPRYVAALDRVLADGVRRWQRVRGDRNPSALTQRLLTLTAHLDPADTTARDLLWVAPRRGRHDVLGWATQVAAFDDDKTPRLALVPVAALFTGSLNDFIALVLDDGYDPEVVHTARQLCDNLDQLPDLTAAVSAATGV